MEQRVFGDKKEGLKYEIRKGAYAVIFNSTKDKILTVQTASGHHFLPGGRIEDNETAKECLKREVLEETGHEISIGTFIGKAMRYFQSIKNEPILSEGYFYLAELTNKVQAPIDAEVKSV